MNRLNIFLTALAAVMLTAGISYAGGIDHGSWEEYTALTNGTTHAHEHLAGANMVDRNGSEFGSAREVVLNYETGEVRYVTVEGTSGIEGLKASTDEHYGVAPAWNESEGVSGTIPKDYEETREMDMFL